ncbi:EamA domain-containing membrane protein RarD [Gillisia sp. Hel1_33_143]|uniref:DMT family transporter n=1 Tax=Gillisia sp. Hel1_33_143 TaxID=1336796 RepID=UPI00087D65FC|nr:DMT family transporter [Gillisia sp. Hel1_33_143]SDR65936.1 EamA domain-containing membrane protein RarD [Gillisia sp. Hel1_33_143]
MLNDKLKSYLFFHVIVLIWGFTAVLGALISLDAIPLVWYRMLSACGFILIWILWKRKSLKLPPKKLKLLIIAGLVIALHWLTFFGAIKEANVSITLALLSTGAFFTSILEPIFYKRKFVWYEVFFGLIVMLGLYIIFNVETEHYLGIVLALISAFLSAVFTLMNGKLVKHAAPSVISFYELLTGAVAISIYLIIKTWITGGESGFNSEFFNLQSSDWLYLFILSSICTAFAFIAAVAVMKHLSPYTVMLTTNLEPVYGIILAFLIFGNKEQMHPQFYYGTLIILSTVVLNGYLKTKRKINKPS